MHDFAAYVRRELPDSSWTVYREAAAPTRYIALLRADTPAAEARFHAAPGTQALLAALSPLVLDPVELATIQLVTSSDLAPRHRRR